MKLFFIAFVIFSITNSIYLWRSTGRLVRANKMRYLLIPLILASLACGVNTQLPYSQNTPEVLSPTKSVILPTVSANAEMVVTAETLRIRDGAGEEFSAVGELNYGQIVTCLALEAAKDGGLWCRHELGWSNIRYMKGLK